MRGDKLTDCAGRPDMIVIPPDAFDMRSTVEERTREGVPQSFGTRGAGASVIAYLKEASVAP